MKTLFTNATLLLSDGSVQPGCLGIDGQTIEFVGSLPEGYSALRSIDCEGNLLLPGFVNAHTHLPMSLFRGQGDDLPLMTWLSDYMWPLEDKLTDDSVYWGTLLACAELLRGGVTAVNEMYMFTGAEIEAVTDAGLRGLFGRAVVAADDDGDSRLKEATDLYHQHNGGANGRITLSIAPHAEYTCTVSCLEKCAKAAQELNAPLHVHVSETATEHAECIGRHGCTPTALLHKTGCLTSRTTLAHCVHVTQEDMALIAAAGAHVLHNPGSNLKLGSGIAPVPDMLQRGINVALGTDGAASNNNLDMIEEMRLAALIHKGAHQDPTLVNTAQAFAMATQNGAKAMGTSAGKLEAGCLADIVMLDAHSSHMLPSAQPLSNLVYSAGRLDVLMTMVSGEILYERGAYYSLDIDRVHAEIARVMETF